MENRFIYRALAPINGSRAYRIIRRSDSESLGTVHRAQRTPERWGAYNKGGALGVSFENRPEAAEAVWKAAS